MNDTTTPDDPRRRLRELRAIPERDRTDAQWDELNDLEIQFAPGNRIDDPSPDGRPNSSGTPRPRTDSNKAKGKHKFAGKHFPRARSPNTAK
jgi:hypothetical protein